MIPDYIERTYAGWLGKVIGIRMGAPIEGYSKEKIELLYGKSLPDYLVDYKDFACDDDSNGPIFFVRAYEHYHQVSPREMGYTFLNYISNEHGFFWWGEELSTEHTAYKNLLRGIEAPESGSVKTNGQELAEQIGGQIFIDGFGFMAPGNPKLAADMAEYNAAVTHDLEGIYGARFIAACISLSYIREDIITIIKEALLEIPENSLYKEVVECMLSSKEKGLSKEEAFLVLKEHYWSDKYKGVCHIIPNGGIIALSLIYGEGDFRKTMELVNLCGFDTDCNAGNVGAIMGVLTGIKEEENPLGIPREWIAPIKDIMLASSSVGSLNISTLSENTLLFCGLGHQLLGMDMPKKWEEYESLQRAGIKVSHFEFKDALCGFRAKGNYKNSEVFLRNTEEESYKGERSLKIIVNNLHPGNMVSVYQKSYYEPEDLHDARYEPAFSPVVYPGDEVSGQLYLKTEQNLKAYLYCYDLGSHKTIRFGELILNQREDFKEGSGENSRENPLEVSKGNHLDNSNQWVEIKGRIPFIPNGLIKEVGIQIESCEKEDTFFGAQVAMYLDEFIIKPNPSYSMNMALVPIEEYSLHSVVQQEIQGFTKYNKNLNRIKTADRGILLNGKEHILTGNYYWKDYTYTITFSLIEGMADMWIRNQGNIRSYFVRVSEGSICIGSMFEQGEELFLTASETIECNKEYTLKIKVWDNSIIASINGRSYTGTDDKRRYLHGGIGMKSHENSSIQLIEYQIQGGN